MKAPTLALSALIASLAGCGPKDRPNWDSNMRLYEGRLFGTLASPPGSEPAPDFEIDVLRQCTIDARGREQDDGNVIVEKYEIVCEVPEFKSQLKLGLPLRPELRDAAEWYRGVEVNMLEPGKNVSVGYTCAGSIQPHNLLAGFPNTAKLYLTQIASVRFEHQAPEPDYLRSAKFTILYVLADGCLFDLNGDLSIVQEPADWHVQN